MQTLPEFKLHTKYGDFTFLHLKLYKYYMKLCEIDLLKNPSKGVDFWIEQK